MGVCEEALGVSLESGNGEASSGVGWHKSACVQEGGDGLLTTVGKDTGDERTSLTSDGLPPRELVEVLGLTGEGHGVGEGKSGWAGGTSSSLVDVGGSDGGGLVVTSDVDGDVLQISTDHEEGDESDLRGR